MKLIILYTPAIALQLYNNYFTQDAALKAKLDEHTISLQLKADDLQHNFQLDKQRLAILRSETRNVQVSLTNLQNQAREHNASLYEAKQLLQQLKMQIAADAIAFVDRQKRELLEYLEKYAFQLLKKARN